MIMIPPQRWLPGNSESSVECLCWAPGPRLFSAGLHGLVLEHDLDALATKHQSAATSGAAWCMQYHSGRNRDDFSADVIDFGFYFLCISPYKDINCKLAVQMKFF